MITVKKMKVDIYAPINTITTNDYKDALIDKLVDIRDNIRDTYNQEPTLSCSPVTYYFLERLFFNEKILQNKNDQITFWALPLNLHSPTNGYIYFNVKETNK